MSSTKRLDPHELATRILPRLDELGLDFAFGRWLRHLPNQPWALPITKMEVTAIVSRCLRAEFDASGETDRPVTSTLAREVVLAVASLYSDLASRAVRGA